MYGNCIAFGGGFQPNHRSMQLSVPNNMKALMKIDTSTPAGALERLKRGNVYYTQQISSHPAQLTQEIRLPVSQQKQKPYAVILSCSDSRVPAEYIFSAGIGELFVVRSAGNIIDQITLGSIEYGATFIKASVIVVMGHTHCGAVEATLGGGEMQGNIQRIVDKIHAHIGAETNPTLAEELNVQKGVEEIGRSPLIQQRVESGKLAVVGAIYSIESGHVTFLEG